MAQGSPNPSRFHSLALGKFDNFKARTDGLISAGDTTPSVGLYSLLYANTAGALIISYFDDGSEGQVVKVINVGNGIVSFVGAQIKVTDSSGLGVDGTAEFISHNSAWYETTRAQGAGADVRLIGTLGDATPTVSGTRLIVANSNGADTITNFDDGTTGQEITFLNIGAGAVTLQDSAGGILVADSGGNLVVTLSQSATMVQYSGNWYVTGASRDLGLL